MNPNPDEFEILLDNKTGEQINEKGYGGVGGTNAQRKQKKGNMPSTLLKEESETYGTTSCLAHAKIDNYDFFRSNWSGFGGCHN